MTGCAAADRPAGGEGDGGDCGGRAAAARGAARHPRQGARPRHPGQALPLGHAAGGAPAPGPPSRAAGACASQGPHAAELREARSCITHDVHAARRRLKLR